MTEPTGYRALTAVLRVHRLASSIVSAELQRGFGLRLLDYQALRLLKASEAGTAALGVIARRLDVHATTVTIATDRLENAGLVSRHAHPDDRRATLVTLTAKGTDTTASATAALEAIDFGLSGLSPTEMDTLTETLERVYVTSG